MLVSYWLYLVDLPETWHPPGGGVTQEASYDTARKDYPFPRRRPGQGLTGPGLPGKKKCTRCMACTLLDLPSPGLGRFHSEGWYVFPGCCFSGSSTYTTPPTHTHTHCLRQGSCQRLHRASQAMRHRLPACLPKPLVAYTLSSGVASYSSLGAPRSTLCNWPMTAPNFPCKQWIRDLSLCGRARVRWWGTGRGSYCWQGNSLSQSP